jgi:hypothetical protein
MKKLASLFLIITLFYNVLGYYLMFADQKQQTWVTAMEKRDNSKFEVIKVAINPYAYIVDSGFENVNEDIVVKHKTYHVFKKRIQNNVLELYCLKNNQQEVINSDLKDAVDNQLFNSSNSKENPVKKLFKSMLTDYIQNDTICYVLTSSLYANSSVSYCVNNLDIFPGFYTLNDPPPDFV